MQFLSPSQQEACSVVLLILRLVILHKEARYQEDLYLVNNLKSLVCLEVDLHRPTITLEEEGSLVQVVLILVHYLDKI